MELPEGSSGYLPRRRLTPIEITPGIAALHLYKA